MQYVATIDRCNVLLSHIELNESDDRLEWKRGIRCDKAPNNVSGNTAAASYCTYWIALCLISDMARNTWIMNNSSGIANEHRYCNTAQRISILSNTTVIITTTQLTTHCITIPVVIFDRTSSTCGLCSSMLRHPLGIRQAFNRQLSRCNHNQWSNSLGFKCVRVCVFINWSLMPFPVIRSRNCSHRWLFGKSIDQVCRSIDQQIRLCHMCGWHRASQYLL